MKQQCTFNNLSLTFYLVFKRVHQRVVLAQQRHVNVKNPLEMIVAEIVRTFYTYALEYPRCKNVCRLPLIYVSLESVVSSCWFVE